MDLERATVIALDRVELASVEDERSDVVGQSRRRDAAERGIVRYRCLRCARRLLARFADGTLHLRAHDRHGGLVAVEGRLHVVRPEIIAIDRDHRPLAGYAALRSGERSGDRGGHRSRLDDEATRDRVRGKGRLAPADDAEAAAIGARDHRAGHACRELDAGDARTAGCPVSRIPSHLRLNAPGPHSVPRRPPRQAERELRRRPRRSLVDRRPSHERPPGPH